MKNITIKSLTAVALLASLSSCSDFLDQSSPSSLDGKNIFSTYEYAQGTIANIYQEFGEQNYRARAIWYGYNTDIENTITVRTRPTERQTWQHTMPESETIK